MALSLDEKRDLCGIPVTLNGKPACICGARNDFAKIVTLPGGGISAEFAWETVKRIVSHNRAFLCDDPYGKHHLETKTNW